jgi:PfaD family protein
MLAASSQADVMMAPAADMFEMGVKVQVLKFGTMFAVRAKKLYEIYLAHESLDAIPAALRASLERDYLRQTFEEAWASTRAYFEKRDASQVERAERDPKHRMALVFRAYLGLASRWAIQGEPSRKADYQVWCGPAMGAFNEWAKGSFLERAPERRVVPVALNILTGAAVLTRASVLRAQGVPASPRFAPRPQHELEELLS